MSVNPDWPRPGSVLLHYQRSVRVLESLPEISATITLREGPFYQMSPASLRGVATELLAELDQQCVLNLVASFEATFQVDLQYRRKTKLSDPYSKALRQFDKHAWKAGRRIEIEAILDVWKVRVKGLVRAIGELKQVIEYRHWLAHGRYWNQKSGLGAIEPREVWQRWEVVRNGIMANTPFPLEFA